MAVIVKSSQVRHLNRMHVGGFMYIFFLVSTTRKITLDNDIYIDIEILNRWYEYAPQNSALILIHGKIPVVS